jgi:hypothetical protein
MEKPTRYFWLITGLLVVIKLLLHFFTNSIYELHRDEMMYLAFGSHPALGYASNPPLIGFLSMIVRTLLPHTEFSVRLLPALSGAFVVILVALMTRELGGKNLAVLFAGLAYIISPAFLRSNTLFMPVTFNQFFWVLIFYFSIRMVNTRNPLYWLWISVAAGIAFLNKYSIVFFMTGLIIALLFSSYRKLFRSYYFFLGLITGLLIIFPNLLWQYMHDWPVVGHMEELYRSQLVHVTLKGFLVDQLLMNLPVTWLWLAGLLYFLISWRGKEYRFVSLTYIFVVLLLIFGRGKSYYTLGLYPVLFAAGGYVFEKFLKGKYLWAYFVLLILSLFIGLVGLPYSLPVLKPAQMVSYVEKSSRFVGHGPVTWEDGKVHPIPQDYSDMTGWKDMTVLVAKAYDKLSPEQQEECLIFANNYGEAGAIDFYGKKLGLPSPICLDDSYIFWAPDSISSGPMIVIGGNEEDLDTLFRHHSVIGSVEDPYFREKGVKVYLCTNPTDSLMSYYKERVGRIKALYRRKHMHD